jgi:biotin transport system substrate-specific component
MDRSTLRCMVLASLMAALIAVGAYVSIPAGPVPIALQNMFVLFAGLLLGPAWGAASVLLYLFLGAVGLPVFAGGGGGLAHIAGPTGGYLLGYLPAVAVTGAVSRAKRLPFADADAAILGDLLVYAAGVPWLMLVTHLSLQKAVIAGFAVFIPWDALKIAAAVVVARWARPLAMERAGR